MTNKTITHHTTQQTSGGKYVNFTNINNIKTTDNTYAECHVGGKNATTNRPSTLNLSNYQANIPTGAMIESVTVKIKHKKTQVNNKDCNVQAPTISLMNGSTVHKYSTGDPMSKKAQAPTGTAKESSVTFGMNWDWYLANRQEFGVKIDYPTNANDYEGKIELYYVQVIVNYKTSAYNITVEHLSGEYNNDPYILSVTIFNKNQTNYDPTITLSAPEGFSLQSHSEGDGTFTQVNSRVATFTPKFTPNITSNVVMVEYNTNITYASGVETYTGDFTAVENLNSTGRTKTLTVKKTKPVDPTVDTDTETDTTVHKYTDDQLQPTNPIKYNGTVNIAFQLDINFTESELEQYVDPTYGTLMYSLRAYINDQAATNVYYSNSSSSTGAQLNNNTWGQLNTTTGYVLDRYLKVKDTPGAYLVQLYVMDENDEAVLIRELHLNIRPKKSSLSNPFFNILPVNQEELNRMGSGYIYTAQTMLKEVTSETLVRDWYNTFRIGVFNNPILANITKFDYTDSETGETESIVYDSTDYDSLTPNEIIENADYWSKPPTTPNAYSSLMCEFAYNKDYPLYIIVTGDYPEATTPATITYTEPCIIETETYNGRETNGVYPIPINDIILNDGSSSTLNIGALNNASTLIFYDYPLEEDYGTNNNIAIRGLELRGTIHSNTDNLVLFATLKNTKQESRQRSLVLDELQNTSLDNNQFSIGGIGDLWGFTTLDIVNLEDWEAHLQISNSLNDDTSEINFGDIQLVIYIENIEGQLIRTYINGEDLSYYGAFLTDLKIPEGLKTDTDYINVNGTDINDPYRQNIKGKTIEVEFEVGDCDLEASTSTLREITRLLVNKRDKYNRPIPKRLEFSHYPDVYWEYIMEDTLTTDIDISTYSVKAKLVVPAGTSYDKVATKTNATGYVSGLAYLRPVLQVKPSGTAISITENISGQNFQISYDDTWNGKVVEINCNARRVYLKEDDDDTLGADISSYVDFNSDWFTVLGEFNFSIVNGAIMNVTYKERW